MIVLSARKGSGREANPGKFTGCPCLKYLRYTFAMRCANSGSRPKGFSTYYNV